MLNRFDRKFGRDLLESVPRGPGVYRFLNGTGRIIYIGKAVNLRRRLGQYRKARRLKRHRRMAAIVREAVSLSFERCELELDALLLEDRLIREHRPKWNVQGAYCFLYPFVGIRQDRGAGALELVLTSRPDGFPGFQFYGAYRSRQLVEEGFEALTSLVGVICDLESSRGGIHRFRRVPAAWAASLGSFFQGESQEALSGLVLALTECAWARRQPDRIQDSLNALKRFWKHEAKRLRDARKALGLGDEIISQQRRDELFIRYRRYLANSEARRRNAPTP